MTAADRKRRWRQRRQAGRLFISIELGRELVDELVESGLLGAWDEQSPAAIGRSLLAAAREGMGTRSTGDDDPLCRLRDDQPVRVLVRSLAAAIPADTQDDTAARIVHEEIEHYLRPYILKVVKCRRKSDRSKTIP